MGRKRGITKRMLRRKQEVIDATPERIAMGESQLVDPSRIDSSEQPIGLTRRFTATHLDRLHKNKRLTWRQWYAGDWYRNQYMHAGIASRVVASYDGRVSGGEPAYGLPSSERQMWARQNWRRARAAIPLTMAGFVDRFVLHDELPRYGGRAAMRSVAELGRALDALADWLRLSDGEEPVDEAESSR